MSCHSTYSQKNNTNFHKKTFGSLEFAIPKKDFYMGASIGAVITKINLGAKALFLFRPIEKKKYVQQSSNFYIRYMERRFILGPSLEKRFSFNDVFGISLETGYVYNFGHYAGTRATPIKKWVPLIGGGLDILLEKSIVFRLSYKYLPLPDTKGHVIGIAFLL